MLDELSAIAPVDAVYGYCDDRHDPSLARERVVTLGGVTVRVVHGHELGRPDAALVLSRYAGDVVIFGHTHQAVVLREGGRVALNPGAAGPRRFDLKPRRDYFAGVNSIVISGSRLIFNPFALIRIFFASTGVTAAA